jgi:hypothetical protein
MQKICLAICLDEVVVYTSRDGVYAATKGTMLFECFFWEIHEHVLVMKEFEKGA